MKNKLLQQAQAAIESKISAKDQPIYNKILTAGMKLMFAKKTNAMFVDSIKKDPDPQALITKGVVGLLGVLYKQARGKVASGPMITAGHAMLLEALDFAERAGLLTVDAATLDKATHDYIEQVMNALEDHRPGSVSGMMDKVQGVMGDPQKMAAYKQQGA